MYECSLLNSILPMKTDIGENKRPLKHADLKSLPIQHVVSYSMIGTNAYLFHSTHKTWIWSPTEKSPIVLYEDSSFSEQKNTGISIFRISYNMNVIHIYDILTIDNIIVCNVCITERLELVRKWLFQVGSRYEDPIQVPKWKTNYVDSCYMIQDWMILAVPIFLPLHTRVLWAQSIMSPFKIDGLEFKQILTHYNQYCGISWKDTNHSLVRLLIDEEMNVLCMKHGRNIPIGKLHPSHTHEYKNTIQFCFFRDGIWIISHDCPDTIYPDSLVVVDSARSSINIKCFMKFP